MLRLMEHRLAQRVRQRLLRVLALSTVLMLGAVLASMLAQQRAVVVQKQMYRQLSLATQQRALSQRISKLALWLQQHPADRDAARALNANLAQWRHVQDGLSLGNTKLGIAATDDAVLQTLLEQGAEQMAGLEATIRTLLAEPKTSARREVISRRLLVEDEQCLAQTERVITRIEAGHQEVIRAYNLAQYLVLGLLALVVVGVGLFITYPSIEAVRRLVNQLAGRYGKRLAQLRNLKRAHRALYQRLDDVSAREERYRALVENSADFIYEVSYDGRFLYASPALMARLGILKAEFRTVSYMTFVHKDFRERLAHYYQETINGRVESTYYEFPIVARSGEEIWLGQTGNTIYNGEGRVVRFQFIARDLTTLHRLAQEKDSQQRMLEAVLQSAKDAISTLRPVLDAGGELVRLEWALANPMAQKLFGTAALEGKALADVLPAKEAEALQAWCLQGMRLRQPREAEQTLTLGGQLRWVRMYMATLPEGLVLTLTDITSERQAAQELEKQKSFYETILNHLPSEVVVLTLDQRYTFVNPAAVSIPERRKALLGLNDAEWTALYGTSSNVAELRKAYFAQALETHQVNHWIEQSPGADGLMRYFKRSFCPIEDSAGNICMVVGNGIDITEQKRTEEALEHARQVAEQAAQARQAFINAMSHEMRTPLNCVIGLSHLLLEDAPREDQAENLRTMLFAGKNLLALINDVLDFGKLEAQKVTLEQVPFSLQEVLQGVVATFKHQALQKGIGLRLDMAADLPIQIVGDPVRLTQILTNLLGNAVKFTQVGHVLLRAYSMVRTDHNIHVHFEVQDTGIGIAVDKQEAIFDSFTQAENSTTRLYGGSGLGLSITKHLLGLFGAQIQLRSEPGKGSQFSFTLTLPIAQTTNMTLTVPQTITESNLGHLRVLLVEDNDINRLVATKFLKRWGLEPDIAVHGKEAVEACTSKTYDLVLMDLQMPVLDGFEASRQIRKLPGCGADVLPIVALTAASSYEVEQQVADAGMTATLSKPFNPADLQAILNKLGV